MERVKIDIEEVLDNDRSSAKLFGLEAADGIPLPRGISEFAVNLQRDDDHEDQEFADKEKEDEDFEEEFEDDDFDDDEIDEIDDDDDFDDDDELGDDDI